MHVTMTSYRFILLHMIIVSIVFQLLINGFHTCTLNQHETELNPTLLQGIDTKSFNLSRLNKELISFSFRLRHLFTSDLSSSILAPICVVNSVNIGPKLRHPPLRPGPTA